MTRRWLKRAAVAAALVAAIAVGHNVNVYHSYPMAWGATWGNEGGCEVGMLDLQYGWAHRGTPADWIACWPGIHD